MKQQGTSLLESCGLDLLGIILSYVEYKSWLSVFLTCKTFYKVGWKVFDLSVSNNYAVRYACQHGKLDAVKLLLLNPKVDPSSEDNDAIRWASHNGHFDVVKLLLQHPKVDPSAVNNDAIQLACQQGHLEIVELLLQHPKVDPSAEDNYGILDISVTKISCDWT